jgi:glycerol-3-phosphate dehydrogenase (NAD(P)+)
MRAVVVGGGGWGTVLAHLGASAGHEVTLLARSKEVCAEIRERHTNRKAVPGLALHPALDATDDAEEALHDAAIVVVVVPVAAFREVARRLAPLLTPDQLVVHATKGLELGSRKRMSEILVEETCARQVGVVSGPNLASEIATGMPAGTVAVSRHPRVIAATSALLSSNRFMVFSAHDVVGAELAGAFKNVVALAAGMADTLRVGDNAKALLLTRGLTEITKLSVALGAEHNTFTGLSGFGDLMATCASPRSRNHRVGAALAEGKTLELAVAAAGAVAEGVGTSRVAHELSRELHVDTPLLERVYRVVHKGLAPLDAIEQLMKMPTGKDGLAA